jgi:hypothetical protein
LGPETCRIDVRFCSTSQDILPLSRSCSRGIVWPLRAPVSDGIAPDEGDPPHIVIDGVISLCVPHLPEVREHREYELMDVAPTIPLDVWRLTKYLKIPLLVIEHVRDSDLNTSESFRGHQNHLLMAMSTAVAFLAFLRISLPVFGFLIDRKDVHVYVGWESDMPDPSVTVMLFSLVRFMMFFVYRARDPTQRPRAECHLNACCNLI